MDPALLWLWWRLAAVAPIRPLAWEPPYAAEVALKRQKEKKKDFLVPNLVLIPLCSVSFADLSPEQELGTAWLRSVKSARADAVTAVGVPSNTCARESAPCRCPGQRSGGGEGPLCLHCLYVCSFRSFVSSFNSCIFGEKHLTLVLSIAHGLEKLPECLRPSVLRDLLTRRGSLVPV